ncbi:MAG TPA: bifunctional phosphoribosylaminoimidazolecarboxamide formyltransferase/IMP cyclohydrolase, partial [Burkholderiales bacterium]
MNKRISLISLSDKAGAAQFARDLHAFGIDILSTGGTARLLREAKVPVAEIADYTGFPEMLDGRVKTLHPKVHAGILARRDLPEHMQAMSGANFPTIDLVVVNLYPFVQTISRAGCTLEEAIENIDIGGPTMVRAAAKNWQHVAVVTDPADYPALIAEMKSANGAISLETRYRLARKAFSHTAAYDGAISNYLTATDINGAVSAFPDQINMNFAKVQDLRYGENPHQRAAFYRDLNPVPGALSNYRQLQGKELSYNNIADADAAWECVKTFAQAACVIIKHANPCGVAVADRVADAYRRAFKTDPTSAFGGIIAFNRDVDLETAEAVSQQFMEVLIAPRFTPDAMAALAKKTNVRVLEVPLQAGANPYDSKRVGGGLLVQTPDALNVQDSDLRVVTKKHP